MESQAEAKKIEEFAKTIYSRTTPVVVLLCVTTYKVGNDCQTEKEKSAPNATSSACFLEYVSTRI